MRAEYPDGFLWQCCERENGSEGCRKRNHHVPVEATRKRAKLGKAAASTTSTASVLIEISSDDRTSQESEDEEDFSEEEDSLSKNENTNGDDDIEVLEGTWLREGTRRWRYVDAPAGLAFKPNPIPKI